MAEKDPSLRLRRAVKGQYILLARSLLTILVENNLFIVKRLVLRTDMRNPDPGPRRYTSLAWAAVLGHEETFDFLMTAGHDDAELSKARRPRWLWGHHARVYPYSVTGLGKQYYSHAARGTHGGRHVELAPEQRRCYGCRTAHGPAVL